MKKVLLIIAAALALFFVAVFVAVLLIPEESEPAAVQKQTQTSFENTFENTYDKDDTWTICWYLCGSDLESDGGFASIDLAEMQSVKLPENIKIVIQTGGANAWRNDFSDVNFTERLLYSSNGLEKLDQFPQSNMGDPKTLSDFLRFCAESFSADHTGVILWNHGGGSLTGVAFDELFENDSLSENELYDAFTSVFEPSFSEPPLEFVGFDACLMATVDTAYAFSDVARYMIASQETEPALGWNYAGFLASLAENPGMSGAALGAAICDTYKEACDEQDLGDDITLSVVDLTKIQPLLAAYSNSGVEALAAVYADSSALSDLSRGAKKTEKDRKSVV
jgi:hypothetical protein